MKEVAIDACCLINLLAAEAILTVSPRSSGKRKASSRKSESPALEVALYVPSLVARESLYLLQPDDDDDSKLVKSPIDLTPYFTHGALFECDVGSTEEMELFVQYATRLDDGEAACLAIAESRGWSVATDDRPATTLASRVGVPVLTTAQLVKQWAQGNSVNKQEVATVLLNIQRFAKFIPRQNSPEAAWWFSHLPNE